MDRGSWMQLPELVEIHSCAGASEEASWDRGRKEFRRLGRVGGEFPGVSADFSYPL